MKKQFDIKVFSISKESSCDECGKELLPHSWITLAGEKGALCLSCSDLDHLIYLPSGDAALTRRSRKYSILSAVVLRWSRARKRYERQGILVESEALEKAEQECLADNEARARQRERAAIRREELDQQYIEDFAKRLRELYPGCPSGRETSIAEHACLKYSGRVGRSASAKSLDEKAIELAVIAHIRHKETQYDSLLADGCERREARDKVESKINQVLLNWKA